MSKRQLLILLGVWEMVFLFLGFPSAWDKVFSLVTGLLIIIIAFKFRSATKSIPANNIPYVEHKAENIPHPVSSMNDIRTTQDISATSNITNTDTTTS